MRSTNLTLDARAQSSIDALTDAVGTDPTKATAFLEEGKDVAALADEMDKHIELLKARIMAASAYGDKEGKKFAEFLEGEKAISMEKKDKDDKVIIKKPDENQNNTALLVGPNPKTPKTGLWSANELKTKLEKLRDDLKATTVQKFDQTTWTLSAGLKTNLDEAFKYEMETEGKAKKQVQWETKHFYHVPLAALITYLSKIQTDIKKAKGDVLAELQGGINATDRKFTDVTVAVVPSTSYLTQGEEYVAQIYLAAYNKTDAANVYIGGQFTEMPSDTTAFDPKNASQTLKTEADGIARFRISTGGMSLGDHGYRGMIESKKPDGTVETIPFNIPPFTVAKPACVVSPTKMNVFYRGLENPVAISVPGVDINKVKPSISGDNQLIKSASTGEWIVKPGAGKEAIISVTANINGKDTKVGEVPFRVRQIPTPIPRFNTKTPMDGSIPKSLAQGATGIEAFMENFEFEVKAVVESFEIVFIKDGAINAKPGEKNKLSADQKTAISKLRPGDRFTVENIVCLMPDGKRRPLAPISLRVTN
ncbi:MAG: GldM family protein [Flavobacteriales bacterium]|nr:GldM family protein [Flavobacteriales bacterium]